MGKTLGRRVAIRYRVCTVCGDKKEVSSKNEEKGKLCKSCYSKTIGGYERKCVDCGDIKVVDNLRDSFSKRCKLCSAREVAKNRRGTKSKVPKIIYWYFCGNCSSVKTKRAKTGSILCNVCSHKQPRRKNRPHNPYFDMKEMKMIAPMRYFKICPHCPEDSNTVQVKQASQGGIRPCNKHKYVGKEKLLKEKEKKRLVSHAKTMAKREPKVKKPKARKLKRTKEVSAQAIAKARQLNKEHREELEFKKANPIPQKLSNKDMMAKFLEENKPSVVANDNEPMPHIWVGQGLGSSSSAMGA